MRGEGEAAAAQDTGGAWVGVFRGGGLGWRYSSQAATEKCRQERVVLVYGSEGSENDEALVSERRSAWSTTSRRLVLLEEIGVPIGVTCG